MGHRLSLRSFVIYSMDIYSNKHQFPLMEHFYTVQGEGANAGCAAYFLRLGGCDVGCVWCDVKESWDPGVHPLVSKETMVEMVTSAGSPSVVVTGGEPLMYDLTELTAALKSAGLSVWIETSGAHPFSGTWDWVCFSPKKFKQPHESIYEHADELKIVIYNKSDFVWAEKHAQKVKSSCKLYLQSEWSKEKQMNDLIVDYVKQNPRWRISLQTHKYLNIP